MNKCEYCGCKIFDSDRFCPSCGGPLKQTKETLTPLLLQRVLSPNEARVLLLADNEVIGEVIFKKENPQ